MDLHHNVYRAAGLLIREHGAGASLAVAQKMDELHKDSDYPTLLAWSFILRAIREWQRQELDPDEYAH